MFKLEKVVPWGRSFDEYRRMFALTDTDLRQRILGCADGPASFNAELTATLRSDGFQVAVETVDYEFQKGANQMMRILR